MKKFMFIVIIASLLLVRISSAGPISQEEAQKIAASWYTHIARASVNDYSISDVFALTHDELVTLYVFNFTSGGFVIVAADDACIPILGYSEKNSFPADMSCPAVKDWMEDYSRQVHEAKTKGLSSQYAKSQWDAILRGDYPESTRDVGPLLTTTWWQSPFYNELCPADPAGPNGHAVTGCVATAMAQILKYHNFPPMGVGSNTYTHYLYGELSADFGNTVYDWASMPDKLTSSNIAVATIMYHAGVAVNMDYGVEGSGSNLTYARKAFVDYFNYQPGIQWHNQSDHPDPEDWKGLIRMDLDDQLPVWYGGAIPSVAHAFICDGYKMDDSTFHFNWGWGGTYDGWYAIGALNTPWGNFNLDNHIMTSIKPYNAEIITRITQPEDNSVNRAGSVIIIEAATARGNADQMKITIDGITVATGTSNNLSYSWQTNDADLGSHDVRSWSYSGNDTVYYPINLNVSEWITQASGFSIPLRTINGISAVDSTTAWALARDGISTWWEVPCQDFTRTTDGGQTWIAGTIPEHEDLTILTIEGLSDLKAYAVMFRTSPGVPQGIFVTIDGGNTWEHQETALFNNPASWPGMVHFFNLNDGWCVGDPLTAGGSFEMYTTQDGGANWVQVPDGNIPGSIPTEMGMQGLAAINDTVWFGTTMGRVLKSTDKGNTWTATSIDGMQGKYITPVFRNGFHGLVFNTGENEKKLFETFDGGASWQQVDYSGPFYQSGLAFVPGTVNTWVSTGGDIGCKGQGASYSEDGGHTWTAFPGTYGACFLQMAWVSPRCGWAGGYNSSATEGGIFKFTGDLSVPSATENHDPNANTFSVYPNPFRSNSTIEITVPKTGFVTLSVYDISGKLQELILSERLTSGEQRFDWRSGSLKAGVYFVRLESDTMTQVKKVIIIN
jgi:hypothetical protein